MNKRSVLFVCTENICRSPLAESIFVHRAKESGLDKKLLADSAGTLVSMPGSRPDVRVLNLLKARGIACQRHRARKLEIKDFTDFDLILAMDYSNLSLVKKTAPDGMESKGTLLREGVADDGSLEVPDPYYGSQSGFELVFDLIDEAILSLLNNEF